MLDVHHISIGREVTHQMTPKNHILKVLTGISGSSVLETAALTSGYGESSSMSLEDERCQMSSDL